jgi:hypothetical protein
LTDENLQSAYLNAPLLDLETALRCTPAWRESLAIALIDAYDEYQETDGVTKDEWIAMNLYTSSAVYPILNRALRTHQLEAIKPYFGYLKIFHNGIKKLTPSQKYFCRGDSKRWIDSYGIGSFYTWVNQLCGTNISSLSNIRQRVFSLLKLLRIILLRL